MCSIPASYHQEIMSIALHWMTVEANRRAVALNDTLALQPWLGCASSVGVISVILRLICRERTIYVY